MQKTKKSHRILSVLMTAAMLLTLIPVLTVGVSAATAPRTTALDLTGAVTYGDGNGGGNKDAASEDIIDSIEGWKWYLNADPDNGIVAKTLVLNGLTLASPSVANGGSNALVVPAGTTIVLEGNSVNSITSGGNTGAYNSAGIYCQSDTVTITGIGTLNATGGSSGAQSSGIYCTDLVMEGGTVNAIGGDGSTGTYGVYSSSAIAVKGGTLNAQCSTVGTTKSALRANSGITDVIVMGAATPSSDAPRYKLSFDTSSKTYIRGSFFTAMYAVVKKAVVIDADKTEFIDGATFVNGDEVTTVACGATDYTITNGKATDDYQSAGTGTITITSTLGTGKTFDISRTAVGSSVTLKSGESVVVKYHNSDSSIITAAADGAKATNGGGQDVYGYLEGTFSTVLKTDGTDGFVSFKVGNTSATLRDVTVTKAGGADVLVSSAGAFITVESGESTITIGDSAPSNLMIKANATLNNAKSGLVIQSSTPYGTVVTLGTLTKTPVGNMYNATGDTFGGTLETGDTLTWKAAKSIDGTKPTNAGWVVTKAYAITYSAGAGGSISSAKVNSVSIGDSPAKVADGSEIIFTASPNSNYTVDAWTVDGVKQSETGTTFTYTVATAAATIEVTFKSTGGGGGGSSATNAVLTAGTTASYNNSGSLAIALNNGSYTLSAITVDGKTLTEGTDYTVSGGKVIFSESFLATLSAGDHKIVFDMSGGTDPVLTLTIEDSTPVPTQRPFDDVNEPNWFDNDVLYAYENGLMVGTGDREFSPYTTTSRAMIFTILARMDGVDTSAGDNWYANALAWAMEMEISDGTNPTADVTREQLVTLLYRYAEYKGYDVTTQADLSGFSDTDSVSDWALVAMKWAVSVGLVKGNDDGTLNPTGNAMRCETAALLHRFCEEILK